jgi:hypothetical protein
MSDTTINVHIPSGVLKKVKRTLVSLLITTSAALMIVMMCFIGSDDSNGSVPGGLSENLQRKLSRISIQLLVKF